MCVLYVCVCAQTCVMWSGKTKYWDLSFRISEFTVRRALFTQVPPHLPTPIWRTPVQVLAGGPEGKTVEWQRIQTGGGPSPCSFFNLSPWHTFSKVEECISSFEFLLCLFLDAARKKAIFSTYSTYS